MSDSVSVEAIPFLLPQKISPIDTLWGKYGTNIYLRSQALRPAIVVPSGKEGKPVQSGLFSYDVSTGIFLLITLIYSYLIPRAGHLLKKEFRVIFQKRQTTTSSLFDEDLGAVEFRYRLLIALLGILGLTIFSFHYADQLFSMKEILPEFLLLGGLLASILLFILLKWLLYQMLEYVFFFHDQRAVQFRKAYFSILLGAGWMMFPLIVAQSFISDYAAYYFNELVIGIGIFALLLILHKIIQLFWKWDDSIFYILLYLCTLEILPVLAAFQAIKELSILL
ncbi:MAG: DUF4271 domain-containing protein [Microbacter sp.]